MRNRFILIAVAVAVVPVAGIATAYAVTAGDRSNTPPPAAVATTIPPGAVDVRDSAATDADNIMFTAPGPLATTVRCTIGSWDYVTLQGAPYPGVSGYVPTSGGSTAPVCEPAILARYPRLPGSLTLRRGVGGGNAFRYAVQVRGFSPDTSYTVACYHGEFDSAEAFATFTARTDSGGNAFRDDGCRSSGTARHWVRIGPYRSESVRGKAPAASPSAAELPARKPVTEPTPALPSWRPPTTGKPLRPTGPVTPPPPLPGGDEESLSGEDGPSPGEDGGNGGKRGNTRNGGNGGETQEARDRSPGHGPAERSATTRNDHVRS